MNSHLATSGDNSPSGIQGIMRRRKRLILACILFATGFAYAYSATRTPVYTAVADLKYERQVDISNPLDTNSDVINPQQVALELQTVGTEVSSAQVTEGAAAELGLPPDDRLLRVSTKVVPNTTVVEISASSTEPRMAASIANAVAASFIRVQQALERARLARAVAVVEQKLRSLENPILRTSPDYVLLRQRLNDLQIAEAVVTGNYRVISPAVTPTSPSWPRPLRDVALGFLFGLFAGIGLAVLVEQLDSRPRSHRDVAGILELPVIGSVPVMKKHSLAKGPIVVLQEPNSPAAESLRLLCANLEVAAMDEDLKTILVASCRPGEGKSLTVSNLAVSMAMGGKRVAVIDADLRRPTLHQLFHLENSVGLSSVLSGQAELVPALKRFPLPTLDGSGRGTRLVVLTSGPQVPNPGGLLAAGRMAAVLREMKKSSVDLVLIDSPAFLAVSDSAVVGGEADAVVLLVDVESASKQTLTEAREFLDQLPCRKLGVITVRERRSAKKYGYGYYKGMAGADA